MSDDDRDRSPTPPVGPPNDLPTMFSFSEKQEVSFPHLIAISPSRLHYGVPAHRAYTPVSLPLGTHKLQKLAPNGHAASCPCLRAYTLHEIIRREGVHLSRDHMPRRHASLCPCLRAYTHHRGESAQVAPESPLDRSGRRAGAKRRDVPLWDSGRPATILMSPGQARQTIRAYHLVVLRPREGHMLA